MSRCIVCDQETAGNNNVVLETPGEPFIRLIHERCCAELMMRGEVRLLDSPPWSLPRWEKLIR